MDEVSRAASLNVSNLSGAAYGLRVQRTRPGSLYQRRLEATDFVDDVVTKFSNTHENP